MNPISLLPLGLAILAGCSAADDEGLVPARNLADLENRLQLHGFRRLDDLRRVLLELRTAAQRSDQRALAAAIHFPLTTYEHGTPVRRYAQAADVLADYEALFPERVLNALRNAQYDELFVRDQGAMIGRGEVWLYQYPDGIRIKAINP